MSEARRELPDDLECLAPGPELATVLAGVDRRALSDKDRIRLVQARNRLVAHAQAELYADMYAVTWDEPPEDDPLVADPQHGPYPWTETELAFALRWTRTAAGVRLDQARRMIEDLPAVHAALAGGTIDVPKALLFIDQVACLPREVARRIVDKVLAKAAEQTTGQLRAKLRRLVIAADPQAATAAAKAEVKGRRLQVLLEANNLASLAGYDLAPHKVAASWERINAIAKAARAAGDPRRIDQLRADVFTDLLIGEGAAVGDPVTSGDLDRPGTAEPATTSAQTGAQGSITADGAGMADTALAGPVDFDTPWPKAPADPHLLDPAADPAPAEPAPAEPTGCTGCGLPEPPAVPDEGDVAVDPDHEQLRRFWLAGFDQLATTRPGCPHCHRGATAGTGVMPGPRRGVVDLQMSIYTLMGLDDLPAELAGFGPLLADIARQVVAQRPDLQWRFSVYNEVDDLLAHGITNLRPTTLPTSGSGPPGGRRTKRRPTTEVAAFVRARNRTCIAPGCRRTAKGCELDHTLPWPAGGESEPDNLGPACKYHHTFKHTTGCDLIQDAPGFFGWQTPKGMQYRTTPTPPLYDDIR
jgi:hypothetical protein